MLGFLFGLNARIGRLHYFLGTLLLAALTTAVAFAMVFGGLLRLPGGVGGTLDDLITWPVIVMIGVFAFCTITLQSMRIRDIGWDPVCVIVAWIAIAIVDATVAGKVPAWSFGQGHHGTIVGSLVNLALTAALLFWPSGDQQNSLPAPGEYRRMPDQTPPRQNSSSSVPLDRLSRATRTEFGRR
jgi:uncharacterized membrane protein YhaH (DUF805 family)